nr:DoxX family membrane protein [Cellulophaga sp. HaHa_2_95]
MLLSLIFIIASTSYFFNPAKTVSKLENSPMGFIGNILGTPEIAVILSRIVMLIVGVSLLLGIITQIASMVLIAIVIPITLTAQIGQLPTLGLLFKNIALLGELLFFSINQKLNNNEKLNIIYNNNAPFTIWNISITSTKYQR